MKKQGEIDRATNLVPVRDTEGLSQFEIVALVTVAENEIGSRTVYATNIKKDMNKSGFTDIAVKLALTSLQRKGMISEQDEESEYGTAILFSVTPKGEEWLWENQDRLVLKEITDNDISY